MADATIRMLDAYVEHASSPGFLAGLFSSPARNFHDSQEVEIHIKRRKKDIALVITDLRASANRNASSLYTKKGFIPPAFEESYSVNAFDLITQQHGQNPFQDPNVQASAMAQSFELFQEIEHKIRRTIEVQASQLFQQGKLRLLSQNGEPAYVLDFRKDPAHFPAVTVPWSEPDSDPMADIAALSERIRRDGGGIPSMLVFGARAWRRFRENKKVQAELDNRRIHTGEIRPYAHDQEATRQGHFWMDEYAFEAFTYNQDYDNPENGQSERYVDLDNVIVISGTARRDLSFGSIPRIAPPQSSVLQYMPPRIRNRSGGMDLTVSAYIDPGGRNLILEAGTRPLCIPTQIDGYGCIRTAGASA